MTALILRGDAGRLPLADETVDLIVTSPPYFALRSYRDGNQHYDGQVGSESHPQEWLEALWAVMHECWRVLKPTGSCFVNLGDTRAGSGGPGGDYNAGGLKAGRPRAGRVKRGGVSSWTQADAAWLAGVIDCDGSVSIHCNRREGYTPSFVAWCRVAQTRPEVVQRCFDVTGVGQVYQDGRGVWNWNVAAQQARYVLERIWPWLRIKQTQAIAAVVLARHIEENDVAIGRAVSPEARAYRERLREAVLAWNRGEAHHLSLPTLPKIALPLRREPIRRKSKMLLPHRFAIGCEDGLADPEGIGWIVRQDTVWSKPNGLPESVTDRTRDSHEYIFHMTKQERYFSAVDEVREAQSQPERSNGQLENRGTRAVDGGANQGFGLAGLTPREYNALGKLPGSVWTIPSEPLIIPEAVRRHYDLPDHFACVDDQTEILTPRGWLRHDELQPGEDVAGYDLDAKVARWTRCLGVYRYEHNGPMVAVDKRDLSMRLTENHRCIVRRPHSVVPLVDEVVTAGELGPRHAIPRSATWEESQPTKAIGVPLAALCGWVAAEGWVTSYGEVRLCQSATANPEKVAALDALLAEVPFFVASRSGRKTFRPSILGLRRYVDHREWKGKPHTLVNWALPLGLAQEISRLLPGKLLPWSFVGLPEDERRAVLEAFIDGDGHRRPDGRIGIFQKERHNLDVLQAIAVTLGYKTTLRRGADRWVLYLTTGGRAISLRQTNGVNTPIPREHYKGTVWCPMTGTGTFVARRNGSVFITGNSFPTEIPRRIILGWSPSGVCVECGEGRRPMVAKDKALHRPSGAARIGTSYEGNGDRMRSNVGNIRTEATITGYACACTPPLPPTKPSVILDPFCGTGTSVLVARALGRIGIGVDLSHDYCRLSQWRVFRSGHGAKAITRTHREAQEALFG